MSTEGGASVRSGPAGGDQVVKRYMILSLACGLVPVPVVDMAALGAIQLQMLARLAKSYGVEFSEQRATVLVGTLLGAGGPAAATAASSRLAAHLIPVGGALVAGLSAALFAGASTFAVGRVFIQHFESGGTFLTFDPEKVRQYYSQQFQQGNAEVGKTFAGIRP